MARYFEAADANEFQQRLHELDCEDMYAEASSDVVAALTHPCTYCSSRLLRRKNWISVAQYRSGRWQGFGFFVVGCMTGPVDMPDAIVWRSRAAGSQACVCAWS